jgi:hypothetical protein
VIENARKCSLDQVLIDHRRASSWTHSELSR